MRGLPTGQYIPGTSALHRLDARVKLLCMLLLMAAILAAKTVAGYAVVCVLLGALVALSRLPVRLALGAVTRMWVLFLTTFLMNALFFSSDDVLWSWGVFRLSLTGIRQGVQITAHMALVLVLGTVLTTTTPPLELTAAIETFLRPLKLLRVPVENVAMIVSVAIQFIPTLLEETDTIRRAQIARGARFESRRLTERAASFLPLVVPIFLSAFRRADDLSVAMEARGYQGASGQTRCTHRALHWFDYAVVSASMAVCAMQFVI